MRGGASIFRALRMSRWFGELGALPEGAGGAGEGADVDLVQFAAQFGPGAAAGVLGDAG